MGVERRSAFGVRKRRFGHPHTHTPIQALREGSMHATAEADAPREEPITFASLGLSPETLKGVEQAGFETPTPIQVRAIPVLLSGRDLVAQAQTGTGKTAAF